VLWSGGYVVALIAAVALGRYYRLRYGSVQSRLNLPAVFSALVVAVLLAGAVWMQNTQPWHASLPLVVIGLAIAAVGVAGGCVRWHYLAVAAATVAFATLETFVSTDARYVLLDYLIGGGLIVIGIGDHLLLRNALEPYPDARTI
jgi:hypothetical protein